MKKISLRVVAVTALFATASSCAFKKSPILQSEAIGASASEGQKLLPDNPDYFLGYWYDAESGKTVRHWMENRAGMAVIQGDMVIGTVEEYSSAGRAKSTWVTNEKRWPKAIVPYVLPADFSGIKIIKEAINHYNTRTKIIMRPYMPGDTNWIKFELFPAPKPGKPDSFYNVGGQSRYGCKPSPGEQLVQLNRYGLFDVGTVIHELGHALGLGHEQNRQDREKFLIINTGNLPKDQSGKVNEGTLAQFKIIKLGKDSPLIDFDSNQFYPKNAFAASSNLVTIQVRPNLVRGTYTGNPKNFGNKKRLSAGDIAGIHELYAQEIKNRG